MEIMQSLVKVFQVTPVPLSKKTGTKNESVSCTPYSSVEKVSLVKLEPLEKTSASDTSSLSPKTLTRLVEEQARSHDAIEALQQRVQETTVESVTSKVHQDFKESATKQRILLDQVISSPTVTSSVISDIAGADDESTMLDTSSDFFPSSPLARKLFSQDSYYKHHGKGDLRTDAWNLSPTWKNHEINVERLHRKSVRGRSDTDNDTGVESDTGSDPGSECDKMRQSEPRISEEIPEDVGETSIGKKTLQNQPCIIGSKGECVDELLVYLEMIEEKALIVESLIERAKLDTVVNLRRQIEAEFNDLSLQEIPAKCHEKIERAIQRYLQRELEQIQAHYDRKCEGDERHVTEQHLEQENYDLREKVGNLETSLSRVDMLYLMQKKENEYLAEKLRKMERQMTNEKLKYENALDNVRDDYEEQKVARESLRNRAEQHATKNDYEHSQTILSLRRKLEQEERKNQALKVAGEADQTTIRCLEDKLTEMEALYNSSRQEVGDLLHQIRKLEEQCQEQERKLRDREGKLSEILDERRVLRETLIMSEHEISLLENKLGSENNEAWKDSKREILEDLRTLEKHIKVIHKEKRKLENKYLAFKIENEHLSDSLNSFSKTKDILTPLGSCNVSRQQSNLSSHSSSLSSSLAGSDIEDEETFDSRRVSKSKLAHQSGRRRQRSQDRKDRQFAEAVSRKLLNAQKTLRDQNCNFSSFENSGEDLINEADELVKRVDSLQAEKRAIKMELEAIRSSRPENVKC